MLFKFNKYPHLPDYNDSIEMFNTSYPTLIPSSKTTYTFVVLLQMKKNSRRKLVHIQRKKQGKKTAKLHKRLKKLP